MQRTRVTWPKVRPSSGYRGIYINLDRAIARRRHVEKEIRRIGQRDAYVRLPAVDGRRLRSKSSVEGCFRSQTQAIELAATARAPVHIVEDDVALSSHVAPFIAFAADGGLLDRFDILFLDMWLDPAWDDLVMLDRLYRGARQAAGAARYADLPIVDLTGLRIACTQSYAVTPQGAEKLARLLNDEIAEGPREAVDTHIDRLVKSGAVTAGLVVPFLTGVDLDTGSASDIQPIGAEQMRLYLLLRSAFRIDDGLRQALLPEIGAFRGRFDGVDRIYDLLAAP